MSGISPSAAELEAQWATPQYLCIAQQLKSGFVHTGSSGATGMQVNYVRVWGHD